MAYSNRDEIDLTGDVKEFRVKRIDRYVVTEWHSYRDGRAGVRTLGEFENATQATEVAKMFGLANPGALVNGMDEPDEGGWVKLPMPLGSVALPFDEAILVAPHEVAAAVRRDARLRGDAETIAALDRLKVAVDT